MTHGALIDISFTGPAPKPQDIARWNQQSFADRSLVPSSKVQSIKHIPVHHDTTEQELMVKVFGLEDQSLYEKITQVGREPVGGFAIPYGQVIGRTKKPPVPTLLALAEAQLREISGDFSATHPAEGPVITAASSSPNVVRAWVSRILLSHESEHVLIASLLVVLGHVPQRILQSILIVEQLAPYLESRDLAIRAGVVRILENLGPGAAHELLEFHSEEDEWLRDYIEDVLAD